MELFPVALRLALPFFLLDDFFLLDIRLL